MMSSEEIGYFGVIIPKYDIFQGFFLTYQFEEAQKVLSEIRKLSIPVKVITPFENHDNQLIGAISQLLIAAPIDERIIPFGMALSNVLGKRFFWVEAVHKNGTVFTNIGQMDVTTAEEANKQFHALPAVKEIAIKREIASLMMEKSQQAVTVH